ncbi:hypothetical protein H8S09_10250 [Coprococcus sp. NSJ-10]|uniref:Uncharacterized protein n=1 Tax=Coprococcus hominis (ex Liu et al. 2022) TaxID=2763039 RepID=A0A8I0AHN0_9FIRM|nr:hypothetical protein [Coprococcus hominis (ex Liu et al. 2022)]MBC5663269.1 hypothetical protein [Coprococcus hominis (ex Liu et al. 2022)]
MRNRKIRDVVIELTSLLDIVMILIFAVMIDNAKLTQEKQGDLDQANSKIEMMQKTINNDQLIIEELQSLIEEKTSGDQKTMLKRIQQDEELLRSYKYMDTIISIMNISLKNENGYRNITYGMGTDGETYKEYSIKKMDDDGWNDAINQLKIYISDALIKEGDADKMVYLVFSADYSRVYADDFKEIENILMAIATKDKKIIYYSNELNEREAVKDESN